MIVQTGRLTEAWKSNELETRCAVTRTKSPVARFCSRRSGGAAQRHQDPRAAAGVRDSHVAGTHADAAGHPAQAHLDAVASAPSRLRSEAHRHGARQVDRVERPENSDRRRR